MRKYILPVILVVLLLMPTALAAGDVKINDFSTNVTNGTIPLHTYFTGNVTGNITNWHWKFTNVETNNTTYSSENVTAVHTFGKPGLYNVSLTVWGPNGNDTLTKPSYIAANDTNMTFNNTNMTFNNTNGWTSNNTNGWTSNNTNMTANNTNEW